MTPLGQLPFFIGYLKQVGLFDGRVGVCPLSYSISNAPSKRDVLGVVLLSVLSGHYLYAHITTARVHSIAPRSSTGGACPSGWPTPIIGLRRSPAGHC